MFHGVCTIHQVDTTDGALFVAHLRAEHHHGPVKAAWNHRAIRRGWVPQRPKPFDVEPFGRGDVVSWVDPRTESVLSGQVWSGHPAKDTRWVADGTTYHAVHASQIVARPWSKAQPAA